MRPSLQRLLSGILALTPLAVAVAYDFPQPSPYNAEQHRIADYAARPVKDGIPVYWDGGTLTDAEERILTPPPWFIAGFPPTPMSGIFIGADNDSIKRIMHQPQAEIGWRKLRFLAIDLVGDDADFRDRRRQLKENITNAGLPQLRSAGWRTFTDDDALQRAMTADNEGFILRHEESNDPAVALLRALPYDIGDATVAQHIPGRGEFSGLMGSMEVRTDTGGSFRIGTGFSRAERREPPPLGSRIAYKYKGYTETGKPKNPVFLNPLPPLPQRIGGILKTAHLTWLFITFMLILALLDAGSYRRRARHWDFKSAIVSSGLLGTFIGIWWGLYNFDSSDIAGSVPALLEGLKLSFVTSIIGIALSTLLSVVQTLRPRDTR